MSVYANGGITGAQAGALLQAPIPAGEWRFTPSPSVQLSAVVANTLYAVPWIAPATETLDRIAFGITTAVVGVAKVGFYAATGNRPGALLAEGAADVSTNTVANIEATLLANINVVAGQLYFPSIVFNATPTIRCFLGNPQGGGMLWPIGAPNTGAALQNVPGAQISVPLTYVTGPTPFLPASFGVATIGGGVSPLFAMRRA